jgi:hypothetical protein
MTFQNETRRAGARRLKDFRLATDHFLIAIGISASQKDGDQGHGKGLDLATQAKIGQHRRTV